MRYELLTVCCLSLLTLAAAANAQTPSAGSSQAQANAYQMTIEFKGVQSNEGAIILALYDDPKAFPKKLKQAAKVVKVDPKQKKVRVAELPKPHYAVVAFHDQDSDGKLKKNFMGMPTESIGLANYEKINMRNRPDFKRATVDLSKTQEVSIRLQKVGG